MMSIKFIRDYELLIQTETQELKIVPPFRVVFRGTKSIDKGLNTVNISIYNLKESTRLKITKDETNKELYLKLELRVGYDRLQTLFKGNITYASSRRQGTDIVTEIEGGDGERDYLTCFTSKTVIGKEKP